MVAEPPLLRLECEAGHAYLSMLLHLSSAGSPAVRSAAAVEDRLVALCAATLENFQVLAFCYVSIWPAEPPRLGSLAKSNLATDYMRSGSGSAA